MLLSSEKKLATLYHKIMQITCSEKTREFFRKNLRVLPDKLESLYGKTHEFHL